MAGRKHVFAILVVLERTRFADQRINHVAIVDRATANAEQPRHSLNVNAVMRYIDPLGADRNIHLAADESTGDRVTISTNMDRAVAVNQDASKRFVRVELLMRKRPKLLLFNRKAIASLVIPPSHHFLHELHILIATLEAATAS
jgi:hypothetical protein